MNILSTLQTVLDLLPRRMDSAPARVMLVAIGLQESALKHRRQIGDGPAAGLWQFERSGGCSGVLGHEASRDLMRWVCWLRKVEPKPAALWAALQTDDVLAAAAARLLLYTDAQPLPNAWDTPGAWSYYLRIWRPGKPHPNTWASFHKEAVDVVLAHES